MARILCFPAIVDAMSTTEDELLMINERLLGACCTLDAPQLRTRLAAWRELRDRAQAVEPSPDGARLVLPAEEPMHRVMDLVVSEAECCPFYTFTILVEGPDRRLEISAGPGGGPAVQALLGLDAST